jgi:hypothetical protein
MKLDNNIRWILIYKLWSSPSSSIPHTLRSVDLSTTADYNFVISTLPTSTLSKTERQQAVHVLSRCSTLQNSLPRAGTCNQRLTVLFFLQYLPRMFTHLHMDAILWRIKGDVRPMVAQGLFWPFLVVVVVVVVVLAGLRSSLNSLLYTIPKGQTMFPLSFRLSAITWKVPTTPPSECRSQR